MEALGELMKFRYRLVGSLGILRPKCGETGASEKGREKKRQAKHD